MSTTVVQLATDPASFDVVEDCPKCGGLGDHYQTSHLPAPAAPWCAECRRLAAWLPDVAAAVAKALKEPQ